MKGENNAKDKDWSFNGFLSFGEFIVHFQRIHQHLGKSECIIELVISLGDSCHSNIFFYSGPYFLYCAIA